MTEPVSPTLRKLLLSAALAACTLFTAAFALSWADPLRFEQAVAAMVRMEVERRVSAQLDAIVRGPARGRAGDWAQRALTQADADIVRVGRILREELPARLAEHSARMQQIDCPCRRRAAARTGALAEAVLQSHLRSLERARERLTDLIEHGYAQVTRELLREWRIFTGSNAVAFALLALVALPRRRSAWQLLLPAVPLIGAVGVTGGLYLFNQNWLHTIVFGSYVGFGYSVFLALMVLLLADLLLNRARVISAVGRIAGVVLSPATC